MASDEDSYGTFQDKTFRLDCHETWDKDSRLVGSHAEHSSLSFVWASQRASDEYGHQDWVVSVTLTSGCSILQDRTLLACTVAAAPIPCH